MTTSLYARWKPGRGQARFCAREKNAGLKPGATLKAKRKSRFLVAMLLGMTTKTKDGEKPQSRASAARTLGHKRQDPPFRKGGAPGYALYGGIGHIARMPFPGSYLWANSAVYQAMDGRSSYP